MDNGNVIPMQPVTTPTGMFTKMIDWVLHPQFSDADPIDWLAFLVLAIIAGLLWSKVVKQTLDATLEALPLPNAA